MVEEGPEDIESSVPLSMRKVKGVSGGDERPGRGGARSLRASVGEHVGGGMAEPRDTHIGSGRGQHGGGIALVYKKTMTVKKLKVKSAHTTFEILLASISCPRRNLTPAVIIVFHRNLSHRS